MVWQRSTVSLASVSRPRARNPIASGIRIVAEHDRIVVANSGLHQTLCIVGRRRSYHFESRSGRQKIFRGMRMRGTDIRSAVGWTANHNGYPNKPTRHVADTPGVVDNLVVCDISKTPEHQFDN